MEEAIEFSIHFDKMKLTKSWWIERLINMERRAFFTKGLPAYFFKMGEAFADGHQQFGNARIDAQSHSSR